LRIYKTITLSNPEIFKLKLLRWAQQFEEIIWLDSNKYPSKYSNYDAILAVDAYSKIETSYTNAFKQLKKYQTQVGDYIFGYLGYDLKNDIEELYSKNIDESAFSDLYFFQPKKIFFLRNDTLTIAYLNDFIADIENDYLEILASEYPYNEQSTLKKENIKYKNYNLKIKQRISKKSYFNKLAKIKDYIHKGYIYEVNFCQEFFVKKIQINPLQTFHYLNKISSPPFAAYLKLNNKYLLSASPERFLKKDSLQLISQPIKGTAKRSINAIEDEILKKELLNSKKERAENIMIVDLVRNDLSITAKRGTIKVLELCRLYTFKQVHQLISTISAEVLPNTHIIDIIKSVFPMGSMTGAPKIAAMKIIEELEESKRGIYSSAVGYITPQNDFDFNVVIRSILYNKTKKYTSFTVGGAITAQSNIEKEYEECLIKAEAMIKAIKINSRL